MKYLKLIRYKNLLMLAFMQLIFCFGFLKLENLQDRLPDYERLFLANIFFEFD